MVILDKWYRCDKISPFALGMGNFVLIFEKNAAIGAICSSLGSLPGARYFSNYDRLFYFKNS